jgi:hypothetical protein
MNLDNIQFNRSAIDIGDCFSRGWEILKPNYLMFLVVALIAVILGCIPIVSWFLIGPVLVGIYTAMLKQYGGEKPDFGMLGSGFSKFFPAAIVGILLIFPGILLNSYNLVLRIVQLLAIFNPNELNAGAATIFVLVSFLINIIAIIASIAFGILFTFALPLVADTDLSAIEALKLSARAGMANAGGLFLLLLVLGLVIVAGFLACLIGVLFVLPLVYAALTVAYRQVFPMGSQYGQNMNPPAPQNYGNMPGRTI